MKKHNLTIIVKLIEDDLYTVSVEQELHGAYNTEELTERTEFIVARIRDSITETLKESLKDAIKKSKYN